MVGWSLPVWPSAWGEASKAWTIQCLSEPHLSRGAHRGTCDALVAAAYRGVQATDLGHFTGNSWPSVDDSYWGTILGKS